MAFRLPPERQESLLPKKPSGRQTDLGIQARDTPAPALGHDTLQEAGAHTASLPLSVHVKAIDMAGGLKLGKSDDDAPVLRDPSVAVAKTSSPIGSGLDFGRPGLDLSGRIVPAVDGVDGVEKQPGDGGNVLFLDPAD